MSNCSISNNKKRIIKKEALAYRNPPSSNIKLYPLEISGASAAFIPTT